MSKSITLCTYLQNNARKESLMKNKKLFGILSLILASGLVLAGCDDSPKEPTTSSEATTSVVSSETPASSEQPSESSASDPSSENPSSEAPSSENPSSENPSSEDPSSEDPSSQVVTKYTVKFMNGETVLKTEEVEEGGKATPPADPTKDPDANAFKYVFRKWDKDVNAAITADTTFNAVFAAYAEKIELGKYEEMSADQELEDEGWSVAKYTEQGWSTETTATISLSSNARVGSKAMRLNHWRNGVAFRVSRAFSANELNKSFNALKFSIKAPKLTESIVSINAEVPTAEGPQALLFQYTLNLPSEEYVDYVLPLASADWKMYAHPEQNIKTTANTLGIHEDDVGAYLTSVAFSLKGTHAGNKPAITFFDDVSFVTLENPQATVIEAMGQYNTYTGLTTGDNTVKVSIGENGATTVGVIDLETPMNITGTTAVQGNEMTFTSSDEGATLVYKGKVLNAGQKVEFISATGTLASQVNGMDLNAVQVVENFDQYTTDGQAYCVAHPNADERSGARGAYYSEYYSNNGADNAPWGGNKWSLLGSDGSQLKLKQDGGHSGNQYLCLKNAKSVALRYMQWGLFDGTSEQQSFRGSKFSFWAKTNGRVPAIKVSFFSQTKPTSTTAESDVKINTFNEAAAVASWKHYEIDLDPTLVYYGYMISLEKNNIADSYLYIDDVEVYTANPYATYAPPVPPATKTLKQYMYFIGKIAGTISVNLMVDAGNKATLYAPGLSLMQVADYAIVGDDVTLTFTSGTTYTATIAEDYKTLTFKSITGTDAIANALNGLNFAAIDMAENGEMYDGVDGTTMYKDHTEVEQTGARGAYYIDMYNNGSASSPIGGTGWQLPSSDAMLSLDNTVQAEGAYSLKLKNSKWGNMRYMEWDLYKGTAVGRTGNDTFSIMVKNTMSKAVSTKVMVYKVQQVTSGTQGSSYRAETTLSVPANSEWTEIKVALDPSVTYYGYAVLFTSDWSNEGYLNVDLAHYYHSTDTNPNFKFYTKNNLTLTGTTGAGAATIKFGTLGKVYFTCAGLSADNVEGTYTMEMDGLGNQVMVITVAGQTLTGTYSVSNLGVATFVVSSAEGAAAAYFPADTTFTS